jgi:putative RNA 2'-phosphotransferase
VLRHRPDTLALTLDAAGYVDVAQLLAALAHDPQPLTRAELDRIVREDDKQRFAFDASGTRLRASQGHSLAVTLDYPSLPPPPLLYHGTVARSIDAIREQGLQALERQFVHLSADIATAKNVGKRRGKPIVLTIDSTAMADEHFAFHLSANGVWLTREVPPRFITFPRSRA